MMSDHMFKCGKDKCQHIFKEPKNYNADPKTRNCPKCHIAKGDVMYLGCGKNVYGIMDTMQGFVSQADGKYYDSKSKYYEGLKASDSHIIEAGEHKPNAQAKLRGDYGCKKELKQAIDQILK